MLRTVATAAGVAVALSACGTESTGGDGAGETARQAVNPLYAPERLHTEAPDSFLVEMITSEGALELFVKRAWAPRGVDRFYTLVTNGFYDDTRIHRVVAGQVAQWGLNGDGLVNSAWHQEFLVDDDRVLSNARGTVAFAKGGRNDRTTQLFINLDDNPGLDDQGFAPFARVTRGIEVADRFHAEYGDGPPRGDGPYAMQALAQGNDYLDAEFPELTRIETMRIIPFEGGDA
ncbi:MAG: peptidylprolyl isomerase [Longimicrobiales bacterium]|nr:peptidylprolyl isomerase [Longimicrobiales bacterium]